MEQVREQWRSECGELDVGSMASDDSLTRIPSDDREVAAAPVFACVLACYTRGRSLKVVMRLRLACWRAAMQAEGTEE